MKKSILIITLVLLSVAFLSADVYIKQKTHSGSMMGQPARDIISEQWMGDNKFAQVSEGSKTVIDLAKNVLYIVNHGAKNYVEAKLPLDMSKIMPEQMAGMMSAMKIGVTINPNGQTKKIGEWNCTGYDGKIEMTGMMAMTMTMKIWATTDVPFDWKNYSEKLLPSIMKAGSMRMPFGDDAIKEYKKIKGYQVAMDMTMSVMGQEVKVNMEVLEITKKDAPAGTYAPPAGYAKSDKLAMPSMGG